MEKTKLLTLAIIGLLFINLGTLGILFMKGNEPKIPHEGRPKPKEIIIERLRFDKQQQQEYARLIEWHRGEITRLDDNIRQAKNELYLQLTDTAESQKTQDSLISVINTNQKEIEQTHFRHFSDIKKLCRKDQLENFNALTEDLSRIFAPKPRRQRHD